MDYVQILSRLFIGSHPATVEDIQTLQQVLATTAILNLQADEDMRAIGLDFKPLEAHYRTSSLRLVRVPMLEEQPVLREKLLLCIRALDSLRCRPHGLSPLHGWNRTRPYCGHRLSSLAIGLGIGYRHQPRQTGPAMFSSPRGTPSGPGGRRESASPGRDKCPAHCLTGNEEGPLT